MGMLSTDPDTNHWVDITGIWTLTPNVFASDFPSPAMSAGQWHFSPAKPGGPSNLVVTTGSGTTLRSAMIPVTVTVGGPPAKIEVQIITPPDSLIAAGDTIVSITKIFNGDGLVPGLYCLTTSYQNMLGGLPGHDPVVIIEGKTTTMGQSLNECFFNGVDTVRCVLYRAPMIMDSLEKITVVMNGLSSTTNLFLMHPGDLSRIAIQDTPGKDIDTVTMNYPTGAKYMMTFGYDTFGNKIQSRQTATWTTDGTLHPATNSGNVSQLYYDASLSTSDEAGHIIATAVNKAGVKITDSVYVSISGPGSVISHPQRPVIPKLSLIFRNSQSYVFPLSQSIARSNLSISLYDLSGRALCRINELDISKPVLLNHSIRPGVCCMRLSADGKTIL
jgi:hypothetical protein